MSAELHEIAARAGLQRTYTDARGQSVNSPDESIARVLGCLGYDVSSDEARKATLARLQQDDERLAPATITVEAGERVIVRLRRPAAEITWRLLRDDGTVAEGKGGSAGQPGTGGGSGEDAIVDAADADRPVLDLGSVPCGYHRLQLQAGASSCDTWLIAAPGTCFLPPALRGEARGFGLTAQVYGLRSDSNFGIGDLSDVAALGEGAGAFGAAFLGLSPLHALFPADRGKISPYSPSSRLFIDPIYVDPRRLPDFPASTAGRTLAETPAAERLDDLRKADLVSHDAVWAIKKDALERYWARARYSDDTDFSAYRSRFGEVLELHATFDALSEHFVAQGKHWIGEWPDEFRDARSQAVRRFRAENADRISYHAWLQWVADSQLADAQRRALAAGMPIGLYRDLAVGADTAGAELWAQPDWFVPGVAVGAPPDLLGPDGQNWGLPPFNPRTLAEQGLQAFRTLVAANMRHAGAIRIDHAFQIQRLFVVPDGCSAKDGVYIAYPFEAMLAVLRIESHRARSMVIAEDLGTSPEGFSDAIMDAGVLSYRILTFERDGVAFKAPSTYPRRALAAVATHDLPTFAGWWEGRDTELRERHQVYDAAQARRERDDRIADLDAFGQALDAEGLKPRTAASDEPPLIEAFRFLARTPSMLIALQLEDILGGTDQANLPGPDSGHPNWRRKLPVTVDRILAPGGALARASDAMRMEDRVLATRAHAVSPPPSSTYRLQFHKDFTFAQATEVLPYIAKLGVSHVYASPILKARPGSTHGYDTVDPTQVNPELGGLSGFEQFARAIQEHGLSLLLDIVPNHMGVGGADNPWWLSVLEWGENSPYADTFDIDWERLGAHGKLVAPNLGAQYGEVLEKGDLKLKFEAATGSFDVWFFEHRFPICPLTYPDIIDRAVAVDAADGGDGIDGLLRIGEELRALAGGAAAHGKDIVATGERLKRRIAQLAQRASVQAAIDGAVAVVNGTPGVAESFNALHRLLERQAYRLSYWRVAASDVNYRRFFDIDSLAGVSIERPAVFERAHALIFDLVRRGLVQGLRVDHIDGLADPRAYAMALQRAIGPDFYVVAEKILEPGESLRPWPLSGTTGYEMLNLIDGVFVDGSHEAFFDRSYRSFSGFADSYEDALLAAKRQVLLESFSSELESLVSDIKRIADANRVTRDYSVNALRIALGDLVCAFPVYRTYITPEVIENADRTLVEEVLAKAKKITALPDCSAHDFIAAVLLGTLPTGRPGRATPALLDRFRRRFQQLTGPVMAKSLEDTLFYRYVRFLALNEVGGEPSRFGIPLSEFHAENRRRAAEWPHALTASATHDTKRGEDARARLIALSEEPDLWTQALAIWKAEAGQVEAPDANDQYMFLQALIAAWPIELLDGDDPTTIDELRERFAAYVPKALREGKRHSKWIQPNEAYEKATTDLLDRLLAKGSRFLEAMRPIVRDLAYRGMLISLGRTVLKCTVPGAPDFYQGTALYDFSLVDPDNRRPVRYGERLDVLDSDEDLSDLLGRWQTGAIKLKLTTELLRDRRENREFYANADYTPLTVTGEKWSHLLAFVRRFGDAALLVLVPRLPGSGSARPVLPTGRSFWGGTTIELPPGDWSDILDGRAHAARSAVPVADLLATLPFAVLRKNA